MQSQRKGELNASLSPGPCPHNSNTLRVQVRKYKVWRQTHNYGSGYRNPKYPIFGYFGLWSLRDTAEPSWLCHLRSERKSTTSTGSLCCALDTPGRLKKRPNMEYRFWISKVPKIMDLRTLMLGCRLVFLVPGGPGIRGIVNTVLGGYDTSAQTNHD